MTTSFKIKPLGPETRLFFESVKATPSIRKKLKLCRELAATSAEIQNLLHYSLSPTRNYYLTKLPNYKSSPKARTDISFRQLCNRLAQRTITGKEAENKVAEFFSAVASPCDRDIYKAILLREPLGIGPELVNRGLRFVFIPIFKCMLADNTVIDRDTIPYKECIFTEKLDGFRCIMSHSVALSRTGKLLPNIALQTKAVNFDASYVMDGELWSPSLSLPEIASILNTKDAPLPTDLSYYVFDRLTRADFLERNPDHETYQSRLLYLNASVDGGDYAEVADFVRLIPRLRFQNREQMEANLGKIVAKGGEGLMGRHQDSKYQWKRTRNSTFDLFKIKPFQTIDLSIVGLYPGKGLFTGIMGGVYVDYKGSQVKVGSGWTRAERELYQKNPELILGKTLEVKYLHESEDMSGKKSLNLPTKVRLREDKDM